MIVLIVDDDAQMRACLKTTLQHFGHMAVEAENGEVALKLARVMPIDAVLSDIEMPKMNGLRLLDQLKAINPDIPVILMSGNPPISREDARAKGAATLLSKPFSEESLDEALKMVAA